MSYLVGVKLQSGEIVHRQAENISDLPYVTDDGETLCVVHDQDDFRFTADIGGGLRSGGRAFAGRGLPPGRSPRRSHRRPFRRPFQWTW